MVQQYRNVGCDNMSEIKLGKLEKISDLRTIWRNEEYDFTPWLAKDVNIKLLSDEIGIPIKVKKTIVVEMRPCN